VLIAEGVESGAEARQLRRLGVALAQGYRLGRPAVATRIAHPLADGARAEPRSSDRPVQRRRTARVSDGEIGRAVNIGVILAAALRAVGVATVADLRSLGAVAAWERLRRASPRIATGTTLLQLEGATRGVRITQLTPVERAKLRLLVGLARQAS
jgi:hypothetical protein